MQDFHLVVLRNHGTTQKETRQIPEREVEGGVVEPVVAEPLRDVSNLRQETCLYRGNNINLYNH